MLRLSAGLVGTFALAFVLTTYVNNALGRGSAALPQDLAGIALERSAKGDALTAARPVSQVSTVTTVELVGLSGTTVILRDRAGSVVFQSDPVTNTTIVARDVDLPVVTVRERADSPVSPAATPPPPAPSRKLRRPAMVGCDGLVSSLVDSEMTRVPGLCLSALDRSAWG